LRYTKNYDLIIEGNLITLIISACLSGLLLYQISPLFILFLFVGLLFVLSREATYFLNKKKALNFRDKAKDAFSQKKYKESLDYVTRGIDFAGKMVVFRMGYGESRLQTEMKQEAIFLQKYINSYDINIKSKEDIGTFNGIFKVPSLPKEDIRNYVIIFLILSLVIFDIAYIFFIFL